MDIVVMHVEQLFEMAKLLESSWSHAHHVFDLKLNIKILKHSKKKYEKNRREVFLSEFFLNLFNSSLNFVYVWVYLCVVYEIFFLTKNTHLHYLYMFFLFISLCVAVCKWIRAKIKMKRMKQLSITEFILNIFFK